MNGIWHSFLKKKKKLKWKKKNHFTFCKLIPKHIFTVDISMWFASACSLAISPVKTWLGKKKIKNLLNNKPNADI